MLARKKNSPLAPFAPDLRRSRIQPEFLRSKGRLYLLVGLIAALGFAIFGHGRLSEFVDGSKLIVAKLGLWTGPLLLICWFIAYEKTASILYSVYCRLVAIAGPPLHRKEFSSSAEKILVFCFATICVALTAYVTIDQDSAIKLVKEDGLLENATAVFYIGASIVCLTQCIRAPRLRLFRIHTGALALLFFFVGMEEINWGQRIFEITTPEWLSDVSVQNALSLHNIYSISLFTYPALLVSTTILCIIPLMNHFSAPVHQYLSCLQFPAAPLGCGILFLIGVASYVYIGIRLGTPSPLPISFYGLAPHLDDEFLEFYIGFLFFIFAVTGWRVSLDKPKS